MKTILFTVILFSFCLPGISQDKKSLVRSWVKVGLENLSDTEIAPDTIYTRYTFAKSNELRVSLYPGWDDYKQTWTQSGNNLTIGFDTYQIETLTDTSLTIALEGFRRFRLLAEDYLANKPEHLEQVGMYKEEPLYKANRYVTARYKKEKLRDEIQKNLEGYHGKKAAYFLARFIVTTEGKVENIQIIHGISEGFSNEFQKQILKTSKHWQPAVVNGKPVQTQLSYEIKYLDSTVPYSSGRIN